MNPTADLLTAPLRPKRDPHPAAHDFRARSFYNVPMLQWLSKKRMTGGLVFGPPAWHADRIEDTFDADTPGKSPAPETATPAPDRTLPRERAAQAALLNQLGIARTSAVIPALADQLQALQTDAPCTLILNLLPTQPEFILGSALSHLAGIDLLAGLEALAKTKKSGDDASPTGATKVQIVLDRHDHPLARHWKRLLRTRLRDGDPFSRERLTRVTLVRQLNRYPLADPTILLRAVLGKRLPVGELPPRVGVLLVDPVACWALGRWLRTGQRLTDRPVQLFTQGAAEPRLVLGRIGESLQDFGTRHHTDVSKMQVILNGMLAGHEVDPGIARIDATTESIALRERPRKEVPSACLACGWCVDVCPTALQPIRLMQLAGSVEPQSVRAAAETAKALASREAHESLHCIGCGLCSYVCPTRLPLMHETLRLRGMVVETIREETP